MVSATFVEGTWLLGVGDLLGSIGRLRPLAVMCDKTTVAPGEVEDDMYRARRGADVSLEVDSGGTSDVRSWERRRSWKRRIGWDLLVVTRQRLMCTDVSMEMDRSCSRYQSRGDSEAALRCPGDLTRPHRSFFFFLGKEHLWWHLSSLCPFGFLYFLGMSLSEQRKPRSFRCKKAH